jgi:uncharacterized protein YkwD
MVRRKLPIFVLVVAVLVAGTASTAGAEDLYRRDRMLRLLNKVRRSHNLPTFRINRALSTDAWRHSKRMAQQNRMFHTSSLYAVVSAYRPSTWGENVAKCVTLRQVRSMWMRSPGHRANILKRAFRRIGVGVVKARGWVWVTAIFYGT